MIKPVALLFLALTVFIPDFAGSAASLRPWPIEKANAWYQDKRWLVGCNFTPSTAINQLEMWQAETFDLDTIDREMGWAEQLGFNTIRVFLHSLPWDKDARGYCRRLDRFLAVANRHHIGVMFVLLDSCWDPFPQAGKQREPRPHVHNSGWVQCPGRDILSHPERHEELKAYVKGVVRRFRSDKRVLLWDLYNEPDNMNRPAYVAQESADKAVCARMLLEKAFGWAREAKPMQPVTAGVWAGEWGKNEKLSSLNRVMLELSDVISFHHYGGLAEMKERVGALQRYRRPILCTEYMARPAGSTFESIMPFLKSHKIGAYNWGFVAGKTQTIYPWDSWEKTYTAEPAVWFHDILRPDGKPFDAKETEFIRNLTRFK
jgi:hypothetical protein